MTIAHFLFQNAARSLFLTSFVKIIHYYYNNLCMFIQVVSAKKEESDIILLNVRIPYRSLFSKQA